MTLTIPAQPDPIVRTATIPLIDPGETKTVTLKVGALVPFEEQTTVKVDVDPVPGETNTANNTAEFPVIFTLTASLAVAAAAGAVAVLALLAALVLWRRLSRVQAAQEAVLGGGRGPPRVRGLPADARRRPAPRRRRGGRRPLARRPPGRRRRHEHRRRPLRRLRGVGGQQSASVAMLDATRTGTVVTAIQGRDYARIYVVDLDRGRSPVALSPEERRPSSAPCRGSAGRRCFPRDPAQEPARHPAPVAAPSVREPTTLLVRAARFRGRRPRRPGGQSDSGKCTAARKGARGGKHRFPSRSYAAAIDGVRGRAGSGTTFRGRARPRVG